ncbi:DUF1800 domain-containing protein [Horticoccus luteus]|uniref:DUF1800 domain-containing protein n=1 Tax=Horticoccus luteus TaxID=2862869 RepID=A0A8F9XH40_9BACT|nr:DUF1800 domain-containing protein [Horticoccus luteus]QYM79897.1 DUF1800 domain-containing protein [Horticoccus luteus]
MKLDYSPEQAWQPLPAAAWDAAAARHLLRRAGWSASPDEVTRVLRDGLAPTLDRLFPRQPAAMPVPKSVADFRSEAADYRRKIRQAPREQRRDLKRDFQQQARDALGDLTLVWMQFSLHPDRAAYEKWVSFLGNVYVVSANKVRDPAMLYEHQALLRAGGTGPAPKLTKGVLRSPAMIQYLDLQQNRLGAPNENFGRELMELFTLGVGHYTENDVKQGSRAFTGYRQRDGAFEFAPRQHDGSAKTFLGHTGHFDGDQAIDVIYQQPAAGTRLPALMARFYLSDEPLPDPHLAALGDWWRATGFDLHQLCLRWFSSRLFFDPQFRGIAIKSPQQYYLGLLQDLGLDLAPLPRRVLPALRQMGQPLYTPPNVRGWVGGREWINSATLDARRALVGVLFTPLNENRLNADEQRALARARAAGVTGFSFTDDRFKKLLPLTDAEVTTALCDFLLPVHVAPDYRAAITQFLAQGDAARRLARIRNAAITLLGSPEYQLC